MLVFSNLHLYVSAYMIFQDLKPSNIAVNEDCELKVIYGPCPEVTKLFHAQLSMKFILLINVKMPIILTFISSFDDLSLKIPLI